MVEIIKHGSINEQYRAPIMSFTCPVCGCEFRTDEYAPETLDANEFRVIGSKCPEPSCGIKFVKQSKPAKAILG